MNNSRETNMSEYETFPEIQGRDDLQVRIEGNAGIVTGVNHLKGKNENGEAFDVKLSFTDTYIKRDGRWLVWASQHTRLRQ